MKPVPCVQDMHSVVATSTRIFAIITQSAINWTGDYNQHPAIATRYAHQIMNPAAVPSPAIQTIAMAAAFNRGMSGLAMFRPSVDRFCEYVNGGRS